MLHSGTFLDKYKLYILKYIKYGRLFMSLCAVLLRKVPYQKLQQSYGQKIIFSKIKINSKIISRKYTSVYDTEYSNWFK